jgi:hypothetical protein
MMSNRGRPNIYDFSTMEPGQTKLFILTRSKYKNEASLYRSARYYARCNDLVASKEVTPKGVKITFTRIQ